MAKYLVIGGTGVIGHFVTRQLVEHGHRPVVLSVSGNTRYIRDVVGKVEVVKSDITDAEGMVKVVQDHGITHIAHLAAVVGPEAEENPRKTVKVGIDGMVNMLEAARLNGVQRVVLAGSKAVYGAITGEYGHPTYKPLDEEYPAYPTTVYGIVKLAGEQLALLYQQRHGLEVVALRFSTTMGPGKLHHHGRVAIHSRIIENAMLGRPTHIPHGGDAVRDTVYNADCAHAVVCGLMASRPMDSVFHIGTGYGITIREFGDAVRQFYPEAEIEIGPGPQLQLQDIVPNECVMDITRARQELGYEPRYNLMEMVGDYIATMDRMGLVPTPS